MGTLRERVYQAQLIVKLNQMFPGCVILKNDTNYMQGIPDLVILYRTMWAMLEVKANASSRNQPNQEYFIDLLDSMSFAAFIYPDNEEEVLDALQQTFRTRRTSRLSER